MTNNNNKKPLVSIIIPCHNSQKTIAKAIESCKNQTYKNIEIIVIDDGSTDGSIDVISQEKVVFVKSINKGAPHARNLGLRRSNGELIKFLDSDDELLKEAIDTQVADQFLIKDNQIIYGDYQINANGQKIIKKNIIINNASMIDIIKNDIMTSTPLHRKIMLNKINGFDERLKRGQEWNLHIRLAAIGVEFIHRPDLIYTYHVDKSSSCITNKTLKSSEKFNINIERYLLTYNSVFEACNNLERTAFASLLWALGRQADREENKDIAHQCFTIAKNISPKLHLINTSKLYLLLCKILGPSISESILLSLYSPLK